MKILLSSLLALAVPGLSFADSPPWYRDAGDYIAHRTVRMGFPTAPHTTLLTDGKRYDAVVGKRLSLLDWSVKGPASAWTLGVEAGMLASLERFSRSGQLTFATNTFDGFFGAFVGFGRKGWIVLARVAHLSAHLVDNSPNILQPVNYSHFWEEVIVGKTFPNPENQSLWDLHLQGSLGLNHTSTPASKQPRASLGASFGHSLRGPGSLALLASADMLRAGVENQRPNYSLFAGFGSLNRPGSLRRPFRIGVAHFAGSDYRNQNYNRRHRWTTGEISLEF
jgi:hypothetical protein